MASWNSRQVNSPLFVVHACTMKLTFDQVSSSISVIHARKYNACQKSAHHYRVAKNHKTFSKVSSIVHFWWRQLIPQCNQCNTCKYYRAYVWEISWRTHPERKCARENFTRTHLSTHAHTLTTVHTSTHTPHAHLATSQGMCRRYNTKTRMCPRRDSRVLMKQRNPTHKTLQLHKRCVTHTHVGYETPRVTSESLLHEATHVLHCVALCCVSLLKPRNTTYSTRRPACDISESPSWSHACIAVPCSAMQCIASPSSSHTTPCTTQDQRVSWARLSHEATHALHVHDDPCVPWASLPHEAKQHHVPQYATLWGPQQGTGQHSTHCKTQKSLLESLCSDSHDNIYKYVYTRLTLSHMTAVWLSLVTAGASL